MKIERENYAQDAINEFVQYSCAFLLPGSAHRLAAAVGSGVIIQTERDHLTILTAKHIAEEAKGEEYRLGFFKCSNPLSDFVAGILVCPDDVDVGLLIVKDTLSSQIRSLAVNRNSVPVEEQEIADQDSLVLNGFPAEISHYHQHISEQGFTVLTYWCVPENVSYNGKGRYRLEWRDATAWRSDRPFDLPSPKGMSGGPLWRFRKPVSNSLWSPREIGKIIGIQSAWDRKDTALIEPVTKWSAWFHESIAKVDRSLGGTT
ncbi:MAG: hypothetical protein ISS63_14825 [Desulfobacteraceae bacterium]|nr:hypothetical protein [Desulfobacteraceae bacterium]